MRNKLIILLSVFLLSITFSINGQKLVNSPYSRFNIGTLNESGSFKSLGMGGVSISLRDNSSIFFLNPASYSSLDTNSFVFDFGIDYSRVSLTNGASTYYSQDMNFNHLLMGFPITKGWGFALGIVPLSNGYYNISEHVVSTDPGYNPAIGEYTSTHKGEGSLTNFFFGTGFKLTKQLSAGVNMEILSGQLKRTNQFDFSDYYNVYNNNETENLQLSGINFDYGLQYSLPLKNNNIINAGASITNGKYFNSKYNNLILRYTAYGTRDTVSYVADNSKKSAYFPGSLRFGISYIKINKLTVALDYIATRWSQAKIPGSSGYSADTKSFLFGIEYIPDKYSNYSFLKRIEYRIGGHIEDNYLIINGEQVKEIGGSVGLGIPMNRTYTRTNIFFDFTKKSGSSVNNLHTENYYTLGVSLNLWDFWFLKHKYE
jgi:hypothetical protein